LKDILYLFTGDNVETLGSYKFNMENCWDASNPRGNIKFYNFI